MENYILEIIEDNKLSFRDIIKHFTTYKYSSSLELDNLLTGLKLEDITYDVNERRKSVRIDSNFFVKETIDDVPIFKSFTNLELENVLNALREEEKIYYNYKTQKYSSMPEDYFVKVVHSTKKGLLYFEHEDEYYYLSSLDETYALLNDVIVVKISSSSFRVDSFLNREKVNIICEVVKKDTSYKMLPLNIDSEYPITFKKDAFNNLVEGDRVLVKVDEEMFDGFFTAKVEKVICNKLDINGDYKSLCAAFGFRFDFSLDAVEELNNIKTSITADDLKERIDLRDETVFTIDGEDAMDLDDAISITKTKEGYILKVHIAHVSNYIRLNSALYLDALQNTSSLYFPGSVSPMFPHKISSGVCSLKEGEDKLTRTIEIHYDKTGNKTDFKTYKSVINSKKKMSFEAINKYHETGEFDSSYEPFLKDINNMFTLSDKLTSKKLTRGYMGFENEELCFKLDEDNFPVAVSSRPFGKAQEVIENFMLEANESVSILAGTLPFPFRNHGFPDEKKLKSVLKEIKNLDIKICSSTSGRSNEVLLKILDELKNEENFLVISRLILFSLQRAYYSTENAGHYGLALESYTHSTAPIRRIIDYLVHYLLDFYESEKLTDKELNSLYTTIEDVCRHASCREKDIDLLEYQVNNLEMAKYMSKRIGEEYEMFIQDIKEDKIIVRAKGLNEGIVLLKDFDVDVVKSKNKKILSSSGGEKLKIGHKLIVKVKSVSTEERKIYYSVVSSRQKENFVRVRS